MVHLSGLVVIKFTAKQYHYGFFPMSMACPCPYPRYFGILKARFPILKRMILYSVTILTPHCGHYNNTA